MPALARFCCGDKAWADLTTRHGAQFMIMVNDAQTCIVYGGAGGHQHMSHKRAGIWMWAQVASGSLLCGVQHRE